ncbi:MAG: VOC family protein [Vitreoscilla sp.]|nr:VOC family protein [Vitreoscilla sp.]
MVPQLRIARPVSDPARSAELYARGLGLVLLGRFDDHEGFDGVMLGLPGGAWHFEFTRCRHHAVAPTPTAEDLAVLYLPNEAQWRAACERALAAGFAAVSSFNPYWDQRGRSFQDPDGYRVVLQNAEWRNQAPP